VTKKASSKVFLFILVLCISAAFAFMFSGCSEDWKNYEYKEGDFLLNATVDKTTVSVGDTVTVTVVLKNLSGYTLPIYYSVPYNKGDHVRKKAFGEVMAVTLYPDNYEGGLPYGYNPPNYPSPMSKEYKMTFEKDAEISFTKQFEIIIDRDSTVDVTVGFSIGKGKKTRKSITVSVDPIEITVV